MSFNRKLRSLIRCLFALERVPFYSLPRICIFSLVSIYLYLSTHSKTNTNQFHPKNHETNHETVQYFAEKLKVNLPTPARIKINSVIIRGERHSGTSFLRSIIGKNCPEMTFEMKCEDYRGDLVKNCDGTAFTKGQKILLSNQTDPWLHNLTIDEKYGWKHSILSNETVLDRGDLMIVIFRNYSSWLPKMRQKTYEHVSPKNNLPMSSFLRSEWKNPLTRSDHSHKDSDWYMLDTQHWKNVFEMRNSKYTNWLEYTKLHPFSSTTVKYEDMAANSTIFLMNLLKKFDMPCKPVSEWDPVNCHAKYGNCEDLNRERSLDHGVSSCLNDKCPVYDFKTKKMEFIDSKVFNIEERQRKLKVVKYVDREYEWQQTDWDFALSNLDKNLEKKIGY